MNKDVVMTLQTCGLKGKENIQLKKTWTYAKIPKSTYSSNLQSCSCGLNSEFSLCFLLDLNVSVFNNE